MNARMLSPARAALALLTVLAAPLAAQDDPSLARLRADLTFLASEACEGRGPGTAGIDKAADHIAAAFKAAGLKGALADGGYFQPFTIKGRASLGADNAVALVAPSGTTELQRGADYQPLGLSGSGAAEGPVVFCGYGASAAAAHYDDFHGVDVAGKVVLMVRKLPRYGRTDSPFDDQAVQEQSALATKLGNAASRKAAAVLLCNDAGEADDPLIEFGYAALGEPVPIPAVQIKRAHADRLLREGLGQSLADLERGIDNDVKSRSAPLKGVTAKVRTAVERKPVDVKNVVAVLEGAGPVAHETVVIGAHYDHLGYGGPSSTAPGVKAIHFGADDNASGTAALLELARRLTANPLPVRRRIVFAAFSAEEVGLLGSAHYVKQPPVPLESTVAMINLDMVGRLGQDAQAGKPKLDVGGTGTATEFNALLDRINGKHGFLLKKTEAGTGPSDHTSFYLREVPVFFFFTGLHQQYHKPTDTADLINFAGLKKVTDFVEDLARTLAVETPRPTLVKGKTGGMGGISRISVPRLGFMPGDYSEDAEGVLIGAVSKDGPAEKAGLKDGDVIVAVAGKPVKNMVSYMTAMGTQKRGQPVEITVIRKGQRVLVTATPQ